VKRYNRNNKKHNMKDSVKVLENFYYVMLGHRLNVIGEKKSIFKNLPSRWIVENINKDIWRFVRANWWRGNQR